MNGHLDIGYSTVWSFATVAHQCMVHIKASHWLSLCSLCQTCSKTNENSCSIHTLCLPLSLLLRSNNLEGRVGLLLSCVGWTLLGDLAPTTSTLIVGCRHWRCSVRRSVYNTLICQLATTNKFFCETTAIESLRVCIDGIGDYLGLGREKEK